MKLRTLLIIFLISLLCYNTHAQAELKTDLPLSYLIQSPAGNTSGSPMIILMHGYGSNEKDLFELKSVFPKNYIIISLRAPISLGSDRFQWFRMDAGTAGTDADLKQARAKVTAFITAAVKKYHADPAQVYLSGFSQGAMMCYEVGLTAPQLLKGIAPLSGKIFESLKPQIKKSAALTRLKVFIGHGDADNRVAYSFATEADTYLKQLGLSPVLHTYKDMQHAISQPELNDLLLWLSDK
jgi:phospholipase/carboxylesterase